MEELASAHLVATESELKCRKQALIFQYPVHTHTAQVINYGMKDQDVTKFEVT